MQKKSIKSIKALFDFCKKTSKVLPNPKNDTSSSIIGDTHTIVNPENSVEDFFMDKPYTGTGIYP